MVEDEIYVYCKMCNKEFVSENDDYIILDDGVICEGCFEEYLFECEKCGEIFDKDVMCVFDNSVYCENCHDDIVTFCHSCDEAIYTEDAFYACDEYYCEDCYADLFVYCHECEEDIPVEDAICVCVNINKNYATLEKICIEEGCADSCCGLEQRIFYCNQCSPVGGR